jgi:DNA-binding transcriptional LysR family regulator
VLTAAVQQGLGVAIVPLASVDPAPSGVVTRHFADLTLEIPVGIARRPNGPPPNAALQAFVAILRSHLKNSIPPFPLSPYSPSSPSV